jgi:hypothetical protein
MAARTGRTVDPTLVTDIDSWLRYYKGNNNNVVYRNGAMLVLDPANLKGEPVKTITPVKGYDYVSILTSTRSEHRDAAETKRNAIEERRAESIMEARTAFLDAERNLLEAIDNWKTADSDAPRTAAAIDVGRLTKEVSEAERAFRSAMYPHRYVKCVEDVPFKILDWATRDDRKTSLNLLVNMATQPSERTVIIEADRA